MLTSLAGEFGFQAKLAHGLRFAQVVLQLNALGFQIVEERLCDDGKLLAGPVHDVPVSPDGQCLDVQQRQIAPRQFARQRVQR